MVNKERVKFRIAPARKQNGKMFVSGHVKIIDFNGGATTGIKFSKDFANYVGSQLPYGLGEDRMAYITVIQLSLNDWLVMASYTNQEHAAPLWIAKTKPKWIK